MMSMDATTWNKRYAERELVWGDLPNQFLLQEVDDMPPGKALDLGAGEGRNSLWLASKGWQVVAVDFSSVGINKGRRYAAMKGIEGIKWIEADLLEYEPEERAFDLVLLFYVQLPREQRRTVLSKAAKAVGPGGTLLVVAHHLANLTDGYLGPRDPSVLYTPDEVVEDINADPLGQQLELVSSRDAIRIVNDEEGEHRAIDVLVRAALPPVRTALSS